MKKYVILILSMFMSILIIVGFDLVDRVMISIYGMQKYSDEDYYISYEDKENVIVDVNLKEYTGDEKVLAEYGDEVKIVLEDIEYRGDGYRFNISCKGKGGFDGGKIISLDKFVDTTVMIDNNKFMIGYGGKGSLEGNSNSYIINLYPQNDMDMESISKIGNVKFELNNVRLETYTRK